jgi:signal transduction histidine kinase
MKVRTKIALLLFAVIAIFVAGLLAFKDYDRRRFRQAMNARESERQRSFDEFTRHRGQSLEMFTDYASCLDALVMAIEHGDLRGAESNLSEETLKVYRAHVVWVNDRNGKLIFTRNILYSDALSTVPLPSGGLAAVLGKQRLCHFFARTPLGLMEVRGATVHPSADSARATEPRGYFFAGRLWSNEDVREMAMLTSNDIRLLPANGDTGDSKADARTGSVTFSRSLPGWDSRPVAVVAVRSETPEVQQLNQSSERQFLWLVAFAVVLFMVLLISLNLLVNRPLRALSTGLQTQDLTPIRRLEKQRSEFGGFARLIHAFFTQREELLREIAERRETQKALHESEDRLRHSQKMEAVGRLAGGVAHDFNNLLTGIIGYADLISSHARDPQVRQEASLIRKAGDQAADLTRQLLAFSRKQILQTRVIDLNALVLEMQKLLQRIIGEHIELRVVTAAENARVRADPTQIEQVIINLAVNARDAMPRGGMLTMRTANAFVPEKFRDDAGTIAPGRYVTLCVQDTGCGMDDETRERIFEPFFTTKEPGRGTGLGLATVYGIVRQSGGAIVVETALGDGSTFTIHLPEEDAPVDVPEEIPPIPEKSRRGETVLVVEDDRMVRDLVCAVLDEQGYNVLSAATGDEALRTAEPHRAIIELLISDIIMPGMNGPELARELRRTQPEIRILYISGYSDDDISYPGELAPDVQFLQKPFTPAALGRKVRQVLSEEHAELHA